MKYIIWGAGFTGELACDFLGWDRVKCFTDKNKTGKCRDKDIVPFPQGINYAKENIIVIASEKFMFEMEEELQKKDIKNYIIFREYFIRDFCNVLPQYHVCGKVHHMDYNQILANYHVEAYKRIAIYGMNIYTPYLISEIFFQSGMGSVVAVVDEKARCKEVMGVPVLKGICEMNSIDCVIINKRHSEYDVWEDKLIQGWGGKNPVIDIYDIDKFIPCFMHHGLVKYKNIHKGERCFVVATGPSLRIEDLDRLYEHHELCISVNKIYRVYDRTKWRANYVGVTDSEVYAQMCQDEADGLEMPELVFAADLNKHNQLVCDKTLKNEVQFHLIIDFYMPFYPKFSEDITQGTYFGATVTYCFALQMAAYMGFSEIYLLGVDHSYTRDVHKNHFIPDYYDKGYKNVMYPYESDSAMKAYESAEKYSRRNNIKIYNATRGGELEAFKRVDFDSLFD